MPDPEKPLNRLKPFTRINNEEFIPTDAPDGLGIACGCHTPDDIPDLQADFKKFIEDPKNTGLLGNLFEVLNAAHDVAHAVVQVSNAITQAMKAIIALAAVIGGVGGPLGVLITTLAAIATAVKAVSDFIDNILKAIDDAVKEFLSRIGADLARRAIRRIPQWVPVTKGESSTQITRTQIKEVEGIVTRSYGDPIETPFFQWHHWFNWSFQVQPEDRYKNLLVKGFSLNTDGKQGSETPIIASGTFEVQWDAGALLAGDQGNGPYEAGFDDVLMPDNDGPMTGGNTRDTNWIWPMTGMYAWASGRWVYDCARTDKTSGADPKMMTMITPPRAIATAWWEARQFVENLPAKSSSTEPANRVPAIRFMFLASKRGGYMSYDSNGDVDYEFILDLPPLDVPLTPFPIGHTFAHKRDPGDPPDFPHSTIVIRPRLLREIIPLDFPVGDKAMIKPVIELLPPKDQPTAPPKQVKLTIKASDITGVPGGFAGFILSLGWLDPNLTRASTVKDCKVAFSGIQGRLSVNRDSPANQIKPLFQDDLQKARQKLLDSVDNLPVIPLPPPAKNASINDLINNGLPKPIPHDQVSNLGKDLQGLVHDAINAAFDKIFDGLADLLSDTQTEEWLMRIGVNGRWQTRFLKDLDNKPIAFAKPFIFEIPLGPDDVLFYSSAGVEFNPVGDMMREARLQRVLKNSAGKPLTWNEIVSATGTDLRNIVFDYALKILLGNSQTGLLALGIENTMIGIKDPKSFASPGNNPATDNPIAMKGVATGSTLFTPVAKFARAAAVPGQTAKNPENKKLPDEFILVEDSSRRDYELTGLIQIADQKPE